MLFWQCSQAPIKEKKPTEILPPHKEKPCTPHDAMTDTLASFYFVLSGHMALLTHELDTLAARPEHYDQRAKEFVETRITALRTTVATCNALIDRVKSLFSMIYVPKPFAELPLYSRVDIVDMELPKFVALVDAHTKAMMLPSPPAQLDSPSIEPCAGRIESAEQQQQQEHQE
jgi:hypothetical protein